MTKRVYKTAQGQLIDIGAIILQNETVRAVGNMNVNARGDLLDGNNRVIDQKNQQVSRQHKKLSQASSGTVSTQPLHTSTVAARQSRAAAQAPVAPEPMLEPDQIAELVAIELEAGEPPPVLTGLASAIAKSQQEKSKTSNTKTKSNPGENPNDNQSSL
jgi:UTP:GlnB (protein PII) uridylyltransferase